MPEKMLREGRGFTEQLKVGCGKRERRKLEGLEVSSGHGVFRSEESVRI